MPFAPCGFHAPDGGVFPRLAVAASNNTLRQALHADKTSAGLDATQQARRALF
jgi:hypothetical protein